LKTRKTGLLCNAMIPFTPDPPESNTGRANDLVCYCFEYTKNDIEDDFRKYGCSTILEAIKNEKKNAGCSCQIKNLKGR
jgi:NAD(P)H-nitrite reductase large subunit